MKNDNNQNDNKYKKLYPNFRHVMGTPRKLYLGKKNLMAKFKRRHKNSATIPDCYEVCNTTTLDGEVKLNVIEGTVPHDLNGNMYICQCLGTPEAFMVGDTNIVKINFSKGDVTLKNKLMWTPGAIARTALRDTVHRFDHCGLMFMSPGLGIFSYTEGMYLLPDGRLGITSDVDRPWVIDRASLQVETPLGKREEWLPMMGGTAGEVMGNLFAGYSNSHVIYTDTETGELFLVNYQYRQQDGSNPCRLMRWDGEKDFIGWNVVDEGGNDIRIMQSIHELIFTRDYIIMADTAFVTGSEILSPWKNAPLPDKKTIVYIVDRRNLKECAQNVTAKRVEIDEACIHLIADYENPDDVIKIYMLHTPATNTAEIIRSYDTDMDGVLFSKHIVGYGTLPPLDISSLGKHTLDMKSCEVISSEYIRDEKYSWGPYMYSYMGRQTRPFDRQDLFVMYKGFKRDMLPKRIYDAYKDVEHRRVPLEDMLSGKIDSNNSVARINKDSFKTEDIYEFPDKVLLYTISCMESDEKNAEGYLLAGIVRDVDDNTKTSGHEYWIFDAGNLAAGPICKLSHKTLNNSVLFHTVYLTDEQEAGLDNIKPSYNIDIRKDYPIEELEKFDPIVKEVFEEIIYPCFDGDGGIEPEKAAAVLEELKKYRVCEHAGKEYLIGEERIVNAREFAVRMFDEADRMFNTTGWKVESDKHGVLIESKPIDGPLASGVLVTRASGELAVNADKFFDYITTPKGYAVIDPVSDPDDHEKKPLEVYDTQEGMRLEAAVASTKIPLLAPSDFVVLNAIDKERRMFASKSIRHDSMPGASRYTDDKTPENGHERALNTFVIKVQPLSENRCRVVCINYADMAGKTSAGMNNMINTKVFLNGLYKRMQKACVNFNT